MPQNARPQIVAIEEWRLFGSIMPACLLGMTLVAIHAYTLGVMFGPLEQEFGWSRSEIAAGPLLTSIGTLFLAPFGGRAVDHRGPRKIALIGVPFFAFSIALISIATANLWTWLALHALLAVALILVYPTVWTAAIAVRFDKNRGLALAVALSGTGLTSAIVPFVASRLLEAYGWRGTYIGLGILSFVIVYPLVFFLFDRNEARSRADPHTEKDGIAGPRRRVPSEFRSGKFLRLAAAALIYAICVTIVGINAVPILMEDGFSLLAAAEIAGLIGIGTIFGRILGGVLLDRIDGRYVAVLSGTGALAAVAILLGFAHSTGAAAFACFFLGLAAGAEYDACAYLTTKHFDRRNYGALFGLIGGLSGFGAGIAPFAANAVYDLTGTYDPVLWALMPTLILACLLFLSLGRYPEAPTDRKPVTPPPA